MYQPFFAVINTCYHHTTLQLAKHGSVLHGDQPLLLKVREFQNAVERVNWKAVRLVRSSCLS